MTPTTPKWPYVVALLVGALAGAGVQLATAQDDPEPAPADTATALFDPTTARPEPAPNGVRQVEIVADERLHDIYRGIRVPVVAFNGQFPAPTIRAIQGERVVVTLVNEAERPMTLHFHGFHTNEHDGVHEVVLPGESHSYELETPLPGAYVYHSHVPPAALRSNQEPTGLLIVDPKEARPPAKEIVLFAKEDDTDGDAEEAEFYSFNGVADQYHDAPIEIRRDEVLRIYLANINMETSTFHVHGTVFDAVEMGVPGNPVVKTDSLQLGYAERSMVEVSWPHEGLWMFHDHIAEHLDRGMRGWIRVSP